MLDPIEGMKQYNNKRTRQHEFSAMMVFMSFSGMIVVAVMLVIQSIIG